MPKTALDVTEFFRPDYFIPKLKARSKDGVLKELTAALVKAGGAGDGDLILEMLRQREALGSTGIGSRVAIPHGRSLAVSEMVVLFARSVKGVGFDAVDGEAVTLFFLILAPPNDRANRYLPFLGKLVETLKNDDSRAALEKSETFDDVIAALRGQE